MSARVTDCPPLFLLLGHGLERDYGDNVSLRVSNQSFNSGCVENQLFPEAAR